MYIVSRHVSKGGTTKDRCRLKKHKILKLIKQPHTLVMTMSVRHISHIAPTAILPPRSINVNY